MIPPKIIQTLERKHQIIRNYKALKKQVFQRFKDKTQEQSFIDYNYRNTNLSRIESQIVYEQFDHPFSLFYKFIWKDLQMI